MSVKGWPVSNSHCGFHCCTVWLSLGMRERKKSFHLSIFLFIYTCKHMDTLTRPFWESGPLQGNVKPLIRRWLIAGELGMLDSDQWVLRKISCLVEEIHTVSQHMIFLMMTSEEGMPRRCCQWKNHLANLQKTACILCAAWEQCRCSNSWWPVACVPLT